MGQRHDVLQTGEGIMKLEALNTFKQVISNAGYKTCDVAVVIDILDAAIAAMKCIEKQGDYIISLLRIVPAPDCIDCYSEMTLDLEIMLYMCLCHGGCTCANAAPCPHCSVSRDAADWVENYGSNGNEKSHEPEQFEKMAINRNQERGPSAVSMAKPVTPTKLVIGCQGNAWDELENL